MFLVSFSALSKTWLAAAKFHLHRGCESRVVTLPSCLQLHLLNLEEGDTQKEVKRMVSGLQKSQVFSEVAIPSNTVISSAASHF